MGEIKLPKHGGPNSFKEAWVGLRNRKATVNKRNLQIRDLEKRNAELLAKIASLEQNITGANELRKEFNSLLETCETLDIKMKAYRESLALWLAYAAGENEPNYDVADEKAAALMAKGEK